MKRKAFLCSLGLIGSLFLSGCEVTGTSSSISTPINSTNSSTSSINEYYGEYKETSYGSEYITKVKVIVKDGMIEKVEIMEGSNLYTDSSSWPGNSVWTEKEQEVLKSYEGKRVEDIKNSNIIIVDKVAGATLTSNRLYLAIKDALK